MTKKTFRRSLTQLPPYFGRILKVVSGGTNDRTSHCFEVRSNGVGKGGFAGSAKPVDADPQWMRGFQSQYQFDDLSDTHDTSRQTPAQLVII